MAPLTGDNPLQQYASFFTNAYGGVHALTLAIGLLCLGLLLAGGRWALVLIRRARLADCSLL